LRFAHCGRLPCAAAVKWGVLATNAAAALAATLSLIGKEGWDMARERVGQSGFAHSDWTAVSRRGQ
jgi:hypothetical protein